MDGYHDGVGLTVSIASFCVGRVSVALLFTVVGF